MKEIKLTQGKVALVDDEDFDRLNQFKWYAMRDGCTFYAARGVGGRKNKATEWMHRVIMNTPVEMDTDHKDGDGLNNQKHNLRNCTRSQNLANKKSRPGSVSKYIGVHKGNNKKKEFWRAQLRKNGKSIHVGCFATEEQAALAYNEKAKEIHGEFAKLNIITN